MEKFEVIKENQIFTDIDFSFIFSPVKIKNIGYIFTSENMKKYNIVNNSSILSCDSQLCMK